MKKKRTNQEVKAVQAMNKAKSEVQYVATVGLKEICTSTDRKEVLTKFFQKIFKMLNEGEMSYQTLETTCWVKASDRKLPDMFYELRDEACESGLLKEIGIVK